MSLRLLLIRFIISYVIFFALFSAMMYFFNYENFSLEMSLLASFFWALGMEGYNYYKSRGQQA